MDLARPTHRRYHSHMSAPTPNSDPRQPLRLHEATVAPAWVDYNGHMNVAYYVLIFDHATDAVLDHVGLGADYRAASTGSVFVAEAHVTYEQEVAEGERVVVTSRVLGFDGKRLILFHEMMRIGDPGVLATNEVLCLHVDLVTRRTAPIPKAAAETLERLAQHHGTLAHPSQAGRAIGLQSRRPPRA